MSILEILKNDHDRIRALLTRLINNVDSDPEKRTEILQKIRDEVVPHARAEEAVLYNSMRAMKAPTDMVYHGFAEHAETEVLLHTLETMDTLNLNWKPVAQKLHDSLIHHVNEEETDLFPQAEEVLTDEEAVQMGEAFKALKPQVRDQSALKSTLEMIGNLMPTRFTGTLSSHDASGTR